MPNLVLEAGNIKEHWLCHISKDIKKFNHAGIKWWGGDMIDPENVGHGGEQDW